MPKRAMLFWGGVRGGGVDSLPMPNPTPTANRTSTLRLYECVARIPIAGESK